MGLSTAVSSGYGPKEGNEIMSILYKFNCIIKETDGRARCDSGT